MPQSGNVADLKRPYKMNRVIFPFDIRVFLFCMFETRRVYLLNAYQPILIIIDPLILDK